MSRQRIGLILVALISVALGVLIGLIYRHLFLSTVPQAMIATMVQGTIDTMCVLYGLGIGIALFLWVLGGTLILKIFSKRKA